MRIGIDGRLWSETGVGRYIRNLVWELQNLDKENEYVLFVTTGFKIQDLRLKNKNWKVVETDIHWHSVAEQTKFPNILYKENLDLMHFPYFSLPILYAKPFVVTIHDLIINHFPTGKASTLPYPLYMVKRLGYKFVMDHAVKNSQKIIVPLNSVKEDVIKEFDIPKEKVCVTYEGVESRIKNQESRKNTKYEIPDTKYFVYVGNAYPHKNLDFLIDGFGEFKKEFTDDVKLILVGKDDFFYKRLRGRIERENIENIVLKHSVSDEELFALYANATAFVSASLMEGFGLSPLEAMSSSCPVLVSDIPSFREVCQDSAFYFDPKSVESLSHALDNVLSLDSKKRQEHIKNGLARVNDFSWKKMAEET